MKYIKALTTTLFLTFLLLVSTKHSFGQVEDKEIQQKWAELVVPLKTRASLIDDFTKELIMKLVPDKKLNIKTNDLAKEIISILDSNGNITAASVKNVFSKNMDLTNSFSKVMVKLEDFRDNKTVTQLLEMLPQIEGLENNINLQKNIYNEACKKNKRLDLQFINKNSDLEIKVQF